MIKTLLVLSLFVFPHLASANSCLSLYEKEAKDIQERDGYTQEVGGQIYVLNGNLAYTGGIKVQADIDNWAEDLVEAIKWGPIKFFARPGEPRKAWLETFRKAIKKDCKLDDETDYKELRSMLKELMEDGSFCPQNKIIQPGFMGNKKEFRKVLVNAVKDGKFAQYCETKAVQSDSFRNVKEADQKKSKIEKKAFFTLDGVLTALIQ